MYKILDIKFNNGFKLLFIIFMMPQTAIDEKGSMNL